MSEITAEQAQTVLKIEKQRKAQEFFSEYETLCQKYGLVLVGRIVPNADGYLRIVVDTVAEINR